MAMVMAFYSMYPDAERLATRIISTSECLASGTFSLAIFVTLQQGWVNYKSFVVRYNYSYFKNM